MPDEPIEPTEPIDKDPQAEVVDDQASQAKAVDVDASADSGLPAAKTAVDSTTDLARARYESMMEGQKLRPLINSIYALYNDRPSDTARTILDLLNNDKISKKDKHAVIKILFLMITEKFGVIGATGDGKKDWIETEWLNNFYKTFQEYLKYFDGIAEVEWKNGILTRIAAECFKPFDVSTPEDKEPVWRAKRFSERIDLAEEIDRTIPVKDLEQGKQKGAAVIAGILRQNMSIAYYEGTTGDSGNKYDIQTLAGKYDIALPSKKETWEKKIKEDIDVVERKIKAKEAELERGNEVGDLKELESSISALGQTLKQAFAEIKGLTLPEGVISIDSIITGFRDRLGKIVTKNILRRIQYHVKSLEQAFESGNEDRINRNIRDFLETIRYEQSVNVEEIVTTLEGMRSSEETRIKDLASEIGADPSLASKQGEKLAIRGKVLAKINTAIADFSKLRPKVA